MGTLLWMVECHPVILFLFFFNDTATTEIYTLSLHDALPILGLLEVGSQMVISIDVSHYPIAQYDVTFYAKE